MAFNEDLTFGAGGEDLVEQLMRSWNFKVERAKGYFLDWDLKLNNGVTIEVKNDRLTKTTGNFCLELAALNHSKAHVFAYVVERTIYFSQLEPVRVLALTYPYKKQTGDQEDNISALVPKRQYLEFIKPQIYEIN